MVDEEVNVKESHHIDRYMVYDDVGIQIDPVNWICSRRVRVLVVYLRSSLHLPCFGFLPG